MPEVLTVKGNKPEAIFSARDFEDLIRTHMGDDCAKYYHSQIETLSSVVEDLDKYVDDVDVHSDVEEALKQYGY